MIDFTEIKDGDNWELFARDFFAALGFVIELEPSRGADGGKDLIISEQIVGKIHTNTFKWLVSCKHNAVSGKSVGPSDETDIIERLKQHSCDGFLGFYSTLSSSGLMDRLTSLKEKNEIVDFNVYDSNKISGYFYDTGLSNLASRYFPKSYNKLRPIQQIVGNHIPLECEICHLDWTKNIMLNPGMGIVVHACEINDTREIKQVYVACKGSCDRGLQKRLRSQGMTTLWEDIEDLCNPLGFLKNILAYTNNLRDGMHSFSDEAHEQQKRIYMALAQRVLREVTQEEKERIAMLSEFEI